MHKLMTHLVGGYPSLEANEALALSMAKCDVAFIEIQIPFSDPMADGPTIMAANKIALDRGTTPKDCLKLMKRIKAKVGELPLLFMTYYNIVFNYGVESFCKAAKEAGAYGLIVPDMPIDEEKHEGYFKACKKYKLHAIQVVSPLSSDESLEKISKHASGFLYCVSRTGKTGAQSNLDEQTILYLDRVRNYTSLPLALGFGISTPEHVEAALKKADIAVIGSAVINLYQKGGVKEVENFFEDLKKPSIL